MNLYSIPPLIVSIFTITVGLLVLIRGKKLIYALTTFAVFLWLIGYAIVYSITDYNRALLFVRILYIGVVFIPAFSYHFTTTFLNLKARKTIVRFNYFLSCIFALLTHSDYFISGLYKYYWGYQTKVGLLHNLFLTYFAITMGSVIILLYTYYRQKKKESLFLEATRIRYVLISFFVSTFAGTDFLPNYGLQFYPFGFLCIFFHATATTYAILKYRLMDIRIALTRAGIFVIVYTIVLGVPFGLAGLARPWLMNIFGDGWFWLPMFILLGLATLGPLIYNSLRKQAENLILKEQHRYQQALLDISSTMMLIKELDRLLKTIVLKVVDIVTVSWAAIYLKDEREQRYLLRHQRSRNEGIKLPKEYTIDSQLVKHLYTAKLPVMGEEIGSSGLKIGLAVPCFVDHTMLGFLLLSDKPKGSMYTQDDIAVFKILSNQTALAIENCQFYSQERQRQHYRRIASLDRQIDCMAHEIDNPIQGLLGIMFSIDMTVDELKDVIPADKVEYLKQKVTRATFNAQRVSKMIEAVKEFSKPTTGGFALVSLQNIIESFNYITQPQFKHHSVNFSQELPGTIWLRANKVELEQVLVNLATNSIQSIDEAPKENKREVTLKAYKKDSDTLRIDFTDTGCGIEEKLIEDIFLDFVTTKASSVGTGLGLSISRKIIQRHGGKIWAESEGQGKGASFHIELPIAQDVTEEELKKLEQEEKEKQKRILF